MSVLLLDALQPKAIQQLQNAQDAKREYNKQFKAYSIIIGKPIKFIHQSNYTIIQMLWRQQSQISFTFETVTKQRQKIIFCNTKKTESKLGITKVPFQLPNEFIQIQFSNILTPQCQKLKEFELSNCEVLKICGTNSVFTQQLFIGAAVPQILEVEDKVCAAVINVKNLCIGAREVQLLMENKPLVNLENKTVDCLFLAPKEVSLTKEEVLVEKPQKVAKIVEKPIQIKIKEKKKKVTNQNDFQQNSGSEHSSDYDFEMPSLNVKFFEIQYPNDIFNLEDGKDGQNVKLLTPVKVQKGKFKRQKLIGEKRFYLNQNEIEYDQFIQEENQVEKIENEKIEIEISDVELENDEVLHSLGIENGKLDYQSFTEWKKAGETVVKNYMIDSLTQHEKNEIKQGLLQSKYALENYKLAFKFGVIYDLVQKHYFELEDSDE